MVDIMALTLPRNAMLCCFVLLQLHDTIQICLPHSIASQLAVADVLHHTPTRMQIRVKRSTIIYNDVMWLGTNLPGGGLNTYHVFKTESQRIETGKYATIAICY